MNSDWKHFLQSSDTQVESKQLDVSSIDETTVICDLSGFDTLVIAGGDAADFMQGQFTNDVNAVDASHSQLSAVCNNKGRMIANFRLFQYQQNYFLSLKSDLSEVTTQHLQTHILRAQVAVQEISEQLIHFGIRGKNAEELLSPFIETIHHETDSVSSNEDYIAIRVADSIPRYEIFASFEKAKALWQLLSEQVDIVSSSTWEYFNIKVGLPFIDANTSEAFVPQMTNMDLINGVSFTKGCYTGQEIIARTHYLGKQKRRTYRLNIKSDITPENGTQLATETSTETQYIGTVISNYQLADDSYDALAVTQINAAEEGQLKLCEGASQVSLLDLPYSLDTTEE